MKKLFFVLAMSCSVIFLSAQNNQPAPIYTWGSGLDGSTYQKTAIYSDATYGLLIEAPLNSSGVKLPIQLNWRGSGTTPFYINPSGSVGIGTTSPINRLEVFGSSFNRVSAIVNADVQTGFQAMKTGTNATNWELYVPAGSTDFRFYNAGVGDILSLKNNGNVGIGTTSPAFKLDVAGSVNTTNLTINPTASGNAQIYFKNQGALDWDLGTQVGTASQDFNLYNRGTSSVALSVNKGTNNIGIGTTTPGSFKLAVEGKIWAKEVQVALTNPGPDYVFEKDYHLPTLESIKAYIDKNHHLPEVPSAKEMEANGVNLGEMNMLLLRKIEELTLYMIEQNKEIEKLKERRVSPDPWEKKIEELTLHVIELKKENEKQNSLIATIISKK